MPGFTSDEGRRMRLDRIVDRIVAYILQGHGRIEALDELVARSREEAITNGEAIDRIEAKLDRLLAMKEES